MCGLIGMVGSSKDPELSFKILTRLIEETQIRGSHATGYSYVDIDNEINHFKLGFSPRMFVHLPIWKDIQNVDLKCLIAHTRYSTSGSCKINQNNHPFVSPTKNVSLVHNGVIHLYDQYKNEYKMKTSCDSEILLHTILKEKTIINGIINVFNDFGSTGDFACELIYRSLVKNDTKLYLFRDSSRPLKIVDLTQELGQYFIVSTSKIWNNATKKLISSKKIKNIDPYKIIIIQSENLDVLELSLDKPKRISKQKIKKSKIIKTIDNSFFPYFHNNFPWKGSENILIDFCKNKIEKEVSYYHKDYGNSFYGKVIF